jgi:hypothetical protein
MPTASGHFGMALLLPAGAADEESAGAGVVADDGEAAGGVSPPPHAATMAPTDAIAARSATIAMFFMIVFLLRGSRATSRTETLMPQLDLSRQSRDVLM